MQDNSMEYPEMYYLHWWNAKPSVVARFTPEKDLSGAWLVDRTKRFEVMWAKNKEMRDWFNKVMISTPYHRNQLMEEKKDVIIDIFELQSSG